MTDDEFMQLEIEVKDNLGRLKDACESLGFDFKDRADDLIYDVAEGD